jgi:hypothetical protein
MLSIPAIQILMRFQFLLFGPYSNYKILKSVMISTDKRMATFINALFFVIFCQQKLSTINIFLVLAMFGIENC